MTESSCRHCGGQHAAIAHTDPREAAKAARAHRRRGEEMVARHFEHLASLLRRRARMEARR